MNTSNISSTTTFTTIIRHKPENETKESRSHFIVSGQDILEFINYANNPSREYPSFLQQIKKLETDFLDIKISITQFPTDIFINELTNVINENKNIKTFNIENITSSQTIPILSNSGNMIENLSKQDDPELLRNIFNMSTEIVTIIAKQSYQTYWSSILKYLAKKSNKRTSISLGDMALKVSGTVLEKSIMEVRLGKFIDQLSTQFEITIKYLIIEKCVNGTAYYNSTIKELGKINDNSALLIRQENKQHTDSYIKDTDGDFICPYCFTGISDDPKIYRNDIWSLIEDDGNENDKIFPKAQNDYISCYALNILYLHTLLTGGLSKSIKFTLMNEQGQISKHFFPCAEVLKFSQSDTYNQMIYDFVCSEEDTFEIKLKNHKTSQSEMYIKKTLGWYLTQTLKYSNKYSDNNLEQETEILIKNLQNYREIFKEDYNRVKNLRDLPFQICDDDSYEKYGKHILKEKLFLMVDYMNEFIQ